VPTKSAEDVAFALYEIVLDAGVVPRVLQSDQGKEFIAAMMQEFIRMLGARQVFSMALHPQTQGVVERLHRELRKVLRLLVGSVLRARPRDWPKWLCLAQAKVRHAEIAGSECTPFSCWHGFFGNSPLQSALTALEQIPQELPLEDWVRQLVRDSQEILASSGAALAKAAADRLTARESHAHPRSVTVGDLVMVERAFFEKDLKRLVSNCDGPFQVVTCDDFGAVLADPVTQVECFRGERIALERIIVFHYPVEDLDAGNVLVPEEHEYVVGEMVAFQAAKLKHCLLGKVMRVLDAEGILRVQRWKVPLGEAFGPLARRVWSVMQENETDIKKELCVPVELDEHNVLTAESVEKILAAGLPAGR
jgi:hypothetical protein